MSRKSRFTQAAYKASFLSDPECAYSVGAIVARGGRVISIGANSTKTHPKSPNGRGVSPKRQTHAEVKAAIAALRILSSNDLSSCVMYVIRRLKNGSLAVARPCPSCQNLLSEVGLRTIFFSNREGLLEKMII